MGRDSGRLRGGCGAGTGRLCYASAGHEPALIARPGAPGAVQELETTGPPVGAAPAGQARYEDREADVPPGGTLLAYTDGVTQAHPPGGRADPLGLGRLKRLLGRAASLPPGRLVAGLLGQVRAFCRGRLTDDLALLAARRLRGAGRARP